MEESADLLCDFGSQFLEAAWAWVFPPLRIAQHPNTKRHRVIEICDDAIRLIREGPEAP